MESKKLVRLFGLNQGFHWFIIGLVIPIMTLLMLEKGMNLLQAGVAIAAYSVMVFLLELPTGGMADSIGRKKVYQFSLIVSYVGLTGLLFFRSFELVTIGFALMGASRALSSGTLDAWFVDEFNKLASKADLQAALAKVNVSRSLGLALGTLLGGVVPMVLGKLMAESPYFDIYSGNLLLMSGLTLLQLLLTHIWIVDPSSEQSDGRFWESFQQFPTIIQTSIHYGFRQKTISLLLISSFAWGAGLSGVELLWQPQLENLLGENSQTWIFGVIGTGYFLANALGSVVVTPLCRWSGNQYALIAGGARFLMGSTLLALAFQQSIWGFIGMYWMLFMFNGLMSSPHETLFNNNIPEDRRSTLLSMDSLITQAGGVLGGLGAGYLAETFDVAQAWYWGAGILVLSSFAFLLIPRQESQASAQTSCIAMPFPLRKEND